MTNLAHELGYRVTAEGVEDLDTLNLLRAFGCDDAQGYHIGRPMPAAAFLACLTEQSNAPSPAVPP